MRHILTNLGRPSAYRHMITSSNFYELALAVIFFLDNQSVSQMEAYRNYLHEAPAVISIA
jgi:hypothetical protein